MIIKKNMSNFVLIWQEFTYIFPFVSHVASIVASFPPLRSNNVMTMWMRWWKSCVNVVRFWLINPSKPSISVVALPHSCHPMN